MEELNLESPHVRKIALAMAPDPRQWDLEEIEHKPEGGRCTCGARIQWHFFLRRGEEQLVIGSVCIEETVPYLMKMGASELAETIRVRWRATLREAARARAHAKGMEALRAALSRAGALEAWLQPLEEGLRRHQPRASKPAAKRERLDAFEGSTLARRAGVVKRRISRLERDIPMLRTLAARYDVAWTEPPAGHPDADEWFDLRMLCEDVASRVQEAIQMSVGNRDLGATQVADTIPVGMDAMREWIAAVEPFTEVEALEEYRQMRERINAWLSQNGTLQRLVPQLFSRLHSVMHGARIDRLARWMSAANAVLDDLPDSDRLAELRDEARRIQEERDRCVQLNGQLYEWAYRMRNSGPEHAQDLADVRVLIGEMHDLRSAIDYTIPPSWRERAEALCARLPAIPT